MFAQVCRVFIVVCACADWRPNIDANARADHAWLGLLEQEEAQPTPGHAAAALLSTLGS